MKLITELTEEIEYISEAKEDGSKDHYIKGIFMQADQPNRNGRIYPLKIMEKAVQKYIQTHVENKRAYGELGHPAGPQINLDRVSHIIVELKRDGSNFIGKARLTDTPMGNIAKGLLKSGANLGVSSRGLGSLVEKNGIMEVQDDFHLATVDIVADPSAPDAFVQGIMESAEWVLENGVWKSVQIEQAQKKIRSTSKADLNKVKLQIFESFLKNIK